MKKGKVIGFSIFFAICSLLMIFTIYAFVDTIKLMQSKEGTSALGLFFIVPGYLILAAVTLLFTVIDLICIIVQYKKDKINKTFFLINLILLSLYIVLDIGPVIYLIAR